MTIVYLALFLVGIWPPFYCWQANRGYSLAHAALWAWAAWAAWGLALCSGDPEQQGLEPARYIALCLTAAAGIAVLGARRPYVGAWNLVLLGLLAVMLLPLGESLILGTPSLDVLRQVFVLGTLLVGLGNYLPTRFGPAALYVGVVSGLEAGLLFHPDWEPTPNAVAAIHLSFLCAPWIAWLCAIARPAPASQFDALWFDFRNRYGLVWAQRVREQFNSAAANAGWPAKLYWQGLLLDRSKPAPTEETREKMVETMHAVLQRFLPEVRK
ncbi:MAG: hypothetical protein L0Y72_27475 [Gemmataceae bacterium]|nr:hypothetical protein [Gemmataceae bacterium]MCI0742792.1 hypothetical protein [Gemmataceae bacterium]